MQLVTPCKTERVDGRALTSGHPYWVEASTLLRAAASELREARAVVGKAGMMSEEAAAASIVMIYKTMGLRTKWIVWTGRELSFAGTENG